MSDTTISAAIARHIEELEVAFRHVVQVMDPRLGKEAAARLERKRQALGWAGDIEDELASISWLAPDEWRIAGDTAGDYYLYINFEGTDCLDGAEPETWVAQFLGFAGAGPQLRLDTNALGRAKWKTLLRTEAELIDQLLDAGFRCDAREGVLAMPVSIERAALIAAFEDGDFDTALAPIGAALDRLAAARPILDRLAEEIRVRA